MVQKAHRIQLSLKALLLLVTASAIAIFIVWPKTKWIAIKEDESAYVGGVPKSGSEVAVFVKGPDGTVDWLASGLVVAEKPVWLFEDGIAMRLKLRINWYQEWKISGHKSYHIKILKKTQ